MITLPPSVRVFMATKPADLRKSFDGLEAIVRHVIKQNPLSGHVFVFRNKIGDRVKVLVWDRTGFCIWYKRLEEGIFRFPKGNEASVQVTATEFMLLLEGIDLAGATRQRRFVTSSRTSDVTVR